MTKRIPLTKGYFALVDDQDYDYLSQFKWHAVGNGRRTVYAVRKTRGTKKFRGTVQMHREILGITDRKIQVDHIDNNGLNNTKSNLRIASARQNRQNRKKTDVNKTGYKGVLKNKSCTSYNSWYAKIGVDGNQIYLGSFRSPEAAARAYDQAARQHFGEFANLNFPDA